MSPTPPPKDPKKTQGARRPKPAETRSAPEANRRVKSISSLRDHFGFPAGGRERPERGAREVPAPAPRNPKAQRRPEPAERKQAGSILEA